MAKNGLFLIKPTSVSVTGSGAISSISTNGSVFFSAQTCSINGVFSGEYDNYLVISNLQHLLDRYDVYYRLRASGTDNSTASSYIYQRFTAAATTTTAQSTSTSNRSILGYTGYSNKALNITYFYGPFLAQDTQSNAICNREVSSNADIMHATSTHNQNVSYDGFTVISATNFTYGYVQVYGMRS